MSTLDQTIRFPDGSSVFPSLGVHGKWCAFWADRTPLRSDNDLTSYFDSAEAAIAALVEGGEGPWRTCDADAKAPEASCLTLPKPQPCSRSETIQTDLTPAGMFGAFTEDES